jgi:glutathione S-transferase
VKYHTARSDFLAILQSLERMDSRPLAIWRCLVLLMRMSALIHAIRSREDFAGKDGRERLRQRQAECAEINRQCARLEGRLCRLSAWLLAEPFARMDDLCEDLALVTDDEVHETIIAIARWGEQT